MSNSDLLVPCPIRQHFKLKDLRCNKLQGSSCLLFDEETRMFKSFPSLLKYTSVIFTLHHNDDNILKPEMVTMVN